MEILGRKGDYSRGEFSVGNYEESDSLENPGDHGRRLKRMGLLEGDLCRECKKKNGLSLK